MDDEEWTSLHIRSEIAVYSCDHGLLVPFWCTLHYKLQDLRLMWIFHNLMTSLCILQNSSIKTFDRLQCFVVVMQKMTKFLLISNKSLIMFFIASDCRQLILRKILHLKSFVSKPSFIAIFWKTLKFQVQWKNCVCLHFDEHPILNHFFFLRKNLEFQNYCFSDCKKLKIMSFQNTIEINLCKNQSFGKILKETKIFVFKDSKLNCPGIEKIRNPIQLHWRLKSCKQKRN